MFYSIPFEFILFYSILFECMLLYSILFHSILVYVSPGHASSLMWSTSALRSCYLSSRYNSRDLKRVVQPEMPRPQWFTWSCFLPFVFSISCTDQRNAMCSKCCDCCSLNDGRCMNVLAPSNVAVADGVARVVRRAGLGRGSVTRCANRAS